MAINLLRRLRRKLNKGSAKKLRHQLAVSQERGMLKISGEFADESYWAKEVWLKARGEEDLRRVAEEKPSSVFSFHVSLDEGLSMIMTDEPSVYDFYLKIRRPIEAIDLENFDGAKAEFVEEGGNRFAEYFIKLGRFQYMDIEDVYPYESGERRAAVYITKKGNIALLVNQTPAASVKNQIDKLYYRDGKMVIEGQLFTKSSKIVSGQLFVKGRNRKRTFTDPISFIHNREVSRMKFGFNRYSYKAEIGLDKLHSGHNDDDIMDFFIDLQLHDQQEPKLVRIGRPTGRVKLFLKDTTFVAGDKMSILNPYFTFKGFNLSVEVYGFPTETYEYMQKRLRFSFFHRLMNKGKNVWLVGERSYKAQDTGYHFFKYMREKFPEKEVYYVIEKESPEARNVEPLGNVLYFKSKEHVWNTLISTRVISSHHPDYLYPMRTKYFKRKVKAIKIFLQHGVMGTKNMIANYGKKASGFDTDLFLVSSDFERNMIVTDFGYDEEQVFVTGLSRFDSLFKKDTETKRQLLIIPTWRDWITTDEVFLESEYFDRYKTLVNHPALHKMAADYGFEIIFCLHPNMQKFTSYFKDSPVRVISQGEVNVQQLIKESAMMLTDYSSVAFDFSFLHKPVVYYQFDRGRFIGKRPSHLNLDRDLPGRIAYELESVLSLTEHYSKNGFVMEDEFARRANKFVKHRDEGANDRIYRVIKEANLDKSLAKKIGENSYYQAFFRRFRRSKYYFPIMKIAYKIMMRTVKVDKELILFESGVGKQYADSPRVIFEEIVNRNVDIKKVWVYNDPLPVKDSRTKQIQRLSPQYYYYLAKAGYWVNNQNFPTYLDKRKETTYIQTWHGTPLKKMLFDIENIQGRDEGYLERVHQATKTWDYLISPSPYATNAFRSAFRYDGEILEVGYPRNDLFFKEEAKEIAETVQARLGIPAGKKVILYAPTFRDNQTSKNNKFVFELNFDLEKMKEALGDEYILLLRMHVVVSNKLRIPEEYRDFVMNVSSYPDIQELYLISDILMTDYSSVMFDFANTNRPILYFTYDLEDYRDNIRGFYFDFEREAPGPFLMDTDDIINAVQNINGVQKLYAQKYADFRQKFNGLEDGRAAERVIEHVLKK
ncbi:CDP-glycerol glycerophosphotransferase family protein [Peribacillus sp. SCS-155]|uniref:CDP-glycerol glycerophosphotransferase family protein n=1 Tax=Peribacillus sedimenti TaxID=3115297 RepID=UPI003905DAF0